MLEFGQPVGCRQLRKHSGLDLFALDRAAEFPRANASHVVVSPEIETGRGLSGFGLNIRFKRRYGTAPYRFLLLRRLELASELLAQGVSIAKAALDACFADRSHMPPTFRGAYGFTPTRLAPHDPAKCSTHRGRSGNRLNGLESLESGQAGASS